MKDWKPFETARAFVRKQNLKSEKEWREFRRTELPDDIPTNPNRTYEKQWKGMGDWLGTFRIADREKSYLTFQKAKDWVSKSDINSQTEWRSACNHNIIPEDIPNSPSYVYRENWKSWGDFLGTGSITYKNKVWLEFCELKKWAASVGIYTRSDWEIYFNSNQVPPNIPRLPNRVYSEWSGWPSFFGRLPKGGTSIIESALRIALSKYTKVDFKTKSLFNQRIDIVLPLQKTIIEYDGYHWHKKKVQKDKNLNAYFQQLGWQIIRCRETPLERIDKNDVIVKRQTTTIDKVVNITIHLLENGQINIPKNETPSIDDIKPEIIELINNHLLQLGWISYKDAQLWAQEAKISSEADWRKKKRLKLIPLNIPNNPNKVYPEWTSWSTFLGTDNAYISPNHWLSFKEARDWTISVGIKNSRDWSLKYSKGLMPSTIPRTPDKVYKDSWVSWMHWCGKNCYGIHRKEWMSFVSAKQWVLEHNIKSEQEFRQYKKSILFPSNLPKSPYLVYRDEWKGWKDFLGERSEWASIRETKVWLIQNDINSEKDFRIAKRELNWPENIPKSLESAYGLEWTGWKSLKKN